MTEECTIENAIRLEKETYKKSKIYTWKQFDSEAYKKLYRSCRHGTENVSTINTIYLAATLQNINDQCIIFDSEPWVLLTSLEILAKEGLIDLTLSIIPGSDITHPDCTPLLYNLTPVDDPYWVLRPLLSNEATFKDTPFPVWSYKFGPRFIKELYAKTHEDSMDSLLKKANQDWFKVWYVEKGLTEEEYAVKSDPLATVWAYPELTENVAVVHDGTKPLEF